MIKPADNSIYYIYACTPVFGFIAAAACCRENRIHLLIHPGEQKADFAAQSNGGMKVNPTTPRPDALQCTPTGRRSHDMTKYRYIQPAGQVRWYIQLKTINKNCASMKFREWAQMQNGQPAQVSGHNLRAYLKSN
jgi:hypothetical protein